MSITAPPAVRTVDPVLYGMHFSIVSINAKNNEEIFAHALLTLGEMKKRTHMNFFICKEDLQLAVTGIPHPGRQLIKDLSAEACGLTTWIGDASKEEEDKKAFSEQRRIVEQVRINLEFIEAPDSENGASKASLMKQIGSLCANVFPNMQKPESVNNSQVLTGEFFD